MERLDNARILIYSDDVNVREKVRFAVGSTTHGRTIEWFETATHAAVQKALDTKTFDLVILDGEAAKVGGMGIARQMKHELYVCPPILLLVGRPADAWLATWSEADAAVAAYEQELAEARANANTIGQQSRDNAKAEAETARKSIEASLEQKLAEAEERVAKIKATAMQDVGSIAEETAAAIVSALGGKSAKADVASAVKSVRS